MNIHSLSKVLGFPFAIAFAIFLYLSLETGEEVYSYGLIPPVIILAIIFVLSPQIDFWWYKKHPPTLDGQIRHWLNTYFDFYKKLDTANKQKFEDRLSIFIKAKDFSMMGEEKISMPEDLKAIIACSAIQITFHHETYLFEGYDHIITYQHPFPTPDLPFFHAVEVQHEDGVIIFSLEQLIPSLINNKTYYNIGLHAFLQAWTTLYPSFPADLPDLPDEEHIEKFTGLKLSSIKKLTGEATPSLIILWLNCFFNTPAQFEAVYPLLKKHIKTALTKTNKGPRQKLQ